jgi:hypothetical protein
MEFHRPTLEQQHPEGAPRRRTRAPVSPSTCWREDATPPDAEAPGLAERRARRELMPKRSGKGRFRDSTSGQRQMQRRKLTGYSGPDAAIANQVEWELRKLGYSQTVARYGANIVASGGTYNFQGNERLAFWMGLSTRALRRARALLELHGFIKSYLLKPGEIVPGQRLPVRRFHVVRFTGALRNLATIQNTPRTSVRQRTSASQRSSVADVPKPTQEKATAEFLNELARRTPEFAAHLREIAATGAKPVAEAPTAEELDQLDRELLEIEEQLGSELPPREAPTGPPQQPPS